MRGSARPGGCPGRRRKHPSRRGTPRCARFSENLEGMGRAVRPLNIHHWTYAPMIDALHSISARPVGPVNPTAGAAAGAGRASDREFAASAGLPGLGDYGRRGRNGAPPAGAETIDKTSLKGNGPEAAAGQTADTADGNVTGDSLHLSPEAQAQLRELKQRDAEVRAHERAHMAAGGQYVSGGPSYTYQQGPDGRQYAIGGHVSIDVSSIPDDPEAGAAKARQVRRAALAPGEPSAQDRAVAAKASAQEARATREKREDAETDATDAADGARETETREPGETAAARHVPAASSAAETGTRAATAIGHETNAHALTRAAETYAVMAQRGVMPTALAPGGTGISLQI